MKILIPVILINMMNLFGQSEIDPAINHWRNGDIKSAHEKVLQILEVSPDHQKAQFLLMKSLFIQGKYREALQIFSKIEQGFRFYKECCALAIQLNIHLGNYTDALQFAKQNKSDQLSYLEDFRNKPFTVLADKTYFVAFTGDSIISPDFWPGVAGKINGVQSLIRFDTGGDYIIMGPAAGQKLGIKLKHKSRSIHGATKVTVWHSIIDSMSFDNGPLFLNVPATVMAYLGDYIIFGTNILEQFLSTIDYPNQKFIFTPRNNSQLAKNHLLLLSDQLIKMPFYLWEDHYMIGKGKFGDSGDINLFFDSGLIVLKDVNGEIVQASFSASKESLIKWGFARSNFKTNTFIETNKSLSVESLSQQNTLIWFDKNLKKDRDFGGIRIDGLISHAWLKNYSWTIDFDRMEYSFGLPR